MRVAVISDIHGNAPALDAVLADVDVQAPDAIWCLGDLVGYGAQPNECVRTVRERADVCLLGNHDLSVLGRLDLDDFTHDAAAAARWTQSVLGPEERAFLDSLEPQSSQPGAELFHASARDPVWEYVLTEDSALASLRVTTEPVVLVGHSHVPLALVEAEGRLQGGLAPGGTEVELAEGRWLLNPGSVGQPRDGDPRAAWLLLDTDAGSASFRRRPYDVEAAQAAIRAAALPEQLAARLTTGA
jgi:diadenosine tetraphosphatase ApaH/serine/threonine PP2A family protein phosphatase